MSTRFYTKIDPTLAGHQLSLQLPPVSSQQRELQQTEQPTRRIVLKQHVVSETNATARGGTAGAKSAATPSVHATQSKLSPLSQQLTQSNFKPAPLQQPKSCSRQNPAAATTMHSTLVVNAQSYMNKTSSAFVSGGTAMCKTLSSGFQGATVSRTPTQPIQQDTSKSPALYTSHAPVATTKDIGSELRASTESPVRRHHVGESFGSGSPSSSSANEDINLQQHLLSELKSADSFLGSLDRSIEHVMRTTRAPDNFMRGVDQRREIVEKPNTRQGVPKSLRRPTSALQSRFGEKFKGRSPMEPRLRERPARIRVKKQPSVLNRVHLAQAFKEIRYNTQQLYTLQQKDSPPVLPMDLNIEDDQFQRFKLNYLKKIQLKEKPKRRQESTAMAISDRTVTKSFALSKQQGKSPSTFDPAEISFKVLPKSLAGQTTFISENDRKNQQKWQGPSLAKSKFSFTGTLGSQNLEIVDNQGTGWPTMVTTTSGTGNALMAEELLVRPLKLDVFSRKKRSHQVNLKQNNTAIVNVTMEQQKHGIFSNRNTAILSDTLVATPAPEPCFSKPKTSGTTQSQQSKVRSDRKNKIGSSQTQRAAGCNQVQRISRVLTPPLGPGGPTTNSNKSTGGGQDVASLLGNSQLPESRMEAKEQFLAPSDCKEFTITKKQKTGSRVSTPPTSRRRKETIASAKNSASPPNNQTIKPKLFDPMQAETEAFIDNEVRKVIKQRKTDINNTAQKPPPTGQKPFTPQHSLKLQTEILEKTINWTRATHFSRGQPPQDPSCTHSLPKNIARPSKVISIRNRAILGSQNLSPKYKSPAQSPYSFAVNQGRTISIEGRGQHDERNIHMLPLQLAGSVGVMHPDRVHTLRADRISSSCLQYSAMVAAANSASETGDLPTGSSNENLKTGVSQGNQVSLSAVGGRATNTSNYGLNFLDYEDTQLIDLQNQVIKKSSRALQCKEMQFLGDKKGLPKVSPSSRKTANKTPKQHDQPLLTPAILPLLKRPPVPFLSKKIEVPSISAILNQQQASRTPPSALKHKVIIQMNS